MTHLICSSPCSTYLLSSSSLAHLVSRADHEEASWHTAYILENMDNICIFKDIVVGNHAMIIERQDPLQEMSLA